MRLCKVLLLLALSFPLMAQTPYVTKEDSQNNQGYWYSRIINKTNYRLHCWIGYSEFYVNPRSNSRWYGYSDAWSCIEL